MTHYDGVSWPEAASAEDLKLVSDEMLARRREAAAYYEIMGWRQLGANGYEYKIEGTDPIFDSVGFQVGEVVSMFADPDNPTNETNDFSMTLPLHRDGEMVMDIIKFSYQKNSEELISVTGARVDTGYMENLSSSILERTKTLSEQDVPEETDEISLGHRVEHKAFLEAYQEAAYKFGEDMDVQFQFGICDKNTITRIVEILRRSTPIEPDSMLPGSEESYEE